MKHRSKKSILDKIIFTAITEKEMKEEKNYELGFKSFKTKSAVTEHYKSILNSYELKDIINREHSVEVYHLLRNHPGVEIKMSKPIISIFVGGTEHGTRCFYLNYNDGTKDDFSYTQCVKNLNKV
jgi:hypothetical protein